jgi:hypothetical protein
LADDGAGFGGIVEASEDGEADVPSDGDDACRSERHARIVSG